MPRSRIPRALLLVLLVAACGGGAGGAARDAATTDASDAASDAASPLDGASTDADGSLGPSDAGDVDDASAIDDASVDAGNEPDAHVMDATVDPPDAGDASTDASTTCGNGFLEEHELCDPSLPPGGSPALRCDCNDDDPCTLDQCAFGGSAGSCFCICEHLPQDCALSLPVR